MTAGSKAVHAVAQMLFHQIRGDWGYDPGNPEHEVFYADATELLAHALLHLPEYLGEVASREDCAGSA